MDNSIKIAAVIAVASGACWRVAPFSAKLFL
jgi:hypothetical protein